MPLTTEQRALYTLRLTQAESALHEILMGEKAKVVVDQNGERVEYAAANVDRLRAYIFELKTLLGLRTVTGPMKFWGP